MGSPTVGDVLSRRRRRAELELLEGPDLGSEAQIRHGDGPDGEPVQGPSAMGTCFAGNSAARVARWMGRTEASGAEPGGDGQAMTRKAYSEGAARSAAHWCARTPITI